MGRDTRFKKVRMICSVKGCTNRETYFISKGGDFSGTPNICEDCMRKIANFINPFTGDSEHNQVFEASCAEAETVNSLEELSKGAEPIKDADKKDIVEKSKASRKAKK